MATKGEENVPDSSTEEAGENQPNSTPNPKSNVNSSKRRKIEAQTLTLMDPEVFDCYICCEPLSIPVFQCKNGHVACSDCCSKNDTNKCPLCNTKIGDVRCRAIENVLESLKGSCPNSKYGCKQKLRFDQRKEHGTTCSFCPCSCPLPDCEIVASSKQLYAHFNRMHPGSAINFQYYSSFTVTLNTDDKFLVLRGRKTGALIVLGNRTEALGKAISITCIGSAAVDEGLSFEMVLKTKEATLSFQSVMRGIKELVDDSTPEDFLLIPNKFVGSNNQIKLDLRIW